MYSEYSIQNLLQRKKFASIRKHMALVRTVQKDIEQIIPERFRGKCKVVYVESSTLTLSVRSAIIATQMRLVVPQILTELQRKGSATSQSLKRIKVRMKPVTNDLLKKNKRPPLSPEICQQFEQLAKKVQHKDLARSLHRLAQTGSTQ